MNENEFVGMWKGSSDMRDSTSWVSRLRGRARTNGTWVWSAVIVALAIASPFIAAELVYAVTRDAQAASRTLRRTWDGLTDILLMWVVLEAFWTAKIEGIKQAARKKGEITGGKPDDE
jgi:hypothetical protein